MADLHLKFDLRSPAWATDQSELCAAALQMASWADRLGIDAIRVAEHHCTDDEYLPAPAVFGAALAAVTSRISLWLSAYLLPLHDPLRAAEDLAVLDRLSAGRLEVVVGAGYRPEEFAMFGVDLKDRGRLVETGIATLRKAWTGEPFEWRGGWARVTPTPHRPGGPRLQLAGSSRAAARRAARLDVPFFPSSSQYYDDYQHERACAGLDPAPPFLRPGPAFVHVARDVDEAWKVVGPHALHENNVYAEWTMSAGTAGDMFAPMTLDELKRSSRYRIVTPRECIELIRGLGPHSIFNLHPLVGGLAPETAWQSLRLFEHEVLPHVR